LGATGDAVAGIGIIIGKDLRIEANRIENNGGWPEGGMPVAPNAGVAIGLAIGGAPRPPMKQSDTSITNYQQAGFLTERLQRFGVGTMATNLGTAQKVTDRPALMVHGNIIRHPAGRAICALVIGPVIIVDNRLVGANASRMLRDVGSAASLAGRYTENYIGKAQLNRISEMGQLIDVLGGDAVRVLDLGIAEDLYIPKDNQSWTTGELGWSQAEMTKAASMEATSPRLTQRSGAILFADNQVSLARPSPNGPRGGLSSILMVSYDDIGFVDNQIDVQAARLYCTYDAMLAGATVRATSNRAEEAVLCSRSIVTTASRSAIVALNQSTYALLTQPSVGPFSTLNL
jgi:hypothetical protein